MKLQTNKRPYNTIGEVHHITMDNFEFEHLRFSIKSTTAMTNFVNEIGRFKFDAFTSKKFVIIITPDDCNKPDHKMSFVFFGKIDPKYVNKCQVNMAKQIRWGSSDNLPKSPVACVYCANTDRFRKIKNSVIIPEDAEKNFLVEGPAITDRNGFFGAFEDTDTHQRYGMSYAECQLLETITKEDSK